MTTVIIVIHLMVVVAMIGLILLQRSEGGALGIGGGQGAFMTGRSAGNVLSHTTAYPGDRLLRDLARIGIHREVSVATGAISWSGCRAQTTPVTQTPRSPGTDGCSRRARRICLKQLGGTSGGPQTPPAADGAATPPASGTATPAPATTAPAPTPAPPATATETPAPPAASGGTPSPAPATGQ